MPQHETPFRLACQRWQAAYAEYADFRDRLEAMREQWRAANPDPIRYAITNLAERDAARTGPFGRDGTRRVPCLILSSDPDDLANPAFPWFDYIKARTEWTLQDHGALIIDGMAFPVMDYTTMTRNPVPDAVADLEAHHALELATFDAVEAVELQLWGKSYDAMMDALQTPASDLAELATRQDLYTMNAIDGPFTGYAAIRDSISADVDRLMGRLADFPALVEKRDDAARVEAADLEADRREAMGLQTMGKAA